MFLQKFIFISNVIPLKCSQSKFNGWNSVEMSLIYPFRNFFLGCLFSMQKPKNESICSHCFPRMAPFQKQKIAFIVRNPNDLAFIHGNAWTICFRIYTLHNTNLFIFTCISQLIPAFLAWKPYTNCFDPSKMKLNTQNVFTLYRCTDENEIKLKLEFQKFPKSKLVGCSVWLLFKILIPHKLCTA